MSNMHPYRLSIPLLMASFLSPYALAEERLPPGSFKITKIIDEDGSPGYRFLVGALDSPDPFVLSGESSFGIIGSPLFSIILPEEGQYKFLSDSQLKEIGFDPGSFPTQFRNKAGLIGYFDGSVVSLYHIKEGWNVNVGLDHSPQRHLPPPLQGIRIFSEGDFVFVSSKGDPKVEGVYRVDRSGKFLHDQKISNSFESEEQLARRYQNTLSRIKDAFRREFFKFEEVGGGKYRALLQPGHFDAPIELSSGKIQSVILPEPYGAALLKKYVMYGPILDYLGFWKLKGAPKPSLLMTEGNFIGFHDGNKILLADADTGKSISVPFKTSHQIHSFNIKASSGHGDDSFLINLETANREKAEFTFSRSMMAEAPAPQRQPRASATVKAKKISPSMEFSINDLSGERFTGTRNGNQIELKDSKGRNLKFNIDPDTEITEVKIKILRFRTPEMKIIVDLVIELDNGVRFNFLQHNSEYEFTSHLVPPQFEAGKWEQTAFQKSLDGPTSVLPEREESLELRVDKFRLEQTVKVETMQLSDVYSKLLNPKLLKDREPYVIEALRHGFDQKKRAEYLKIARQILDQGDKREASDRVRAVFDHPIALQFPELADEVMMAEVSPYRRAFIGIILAQENWRRLEFTSKWVDHILKNNLDLDAFVNTFFEPPYHESMRPFFSQIIESSNERAVELLIRKVQARPQMKQFFLSELEIAMKMRKGCFQSIRSLLVE